MIATSILSTISVIIIGELCDQFSNRKRALILSFFLGATGFGIFAIFPEIYKKIKKIKAIDKVRLRTRNQDEIISLFLNEQVDLLLSYQSHYNARLPFDQSVLQKTWRFDTLLPVVGGKLRNRLSDDYTPPSGTPVLRYPQDSELGRIIKDYADQHGSTDTREGLLETTFAASVLALVKAGEGIGWVPQSLARDELRRGEVVPLIFSL